MVAVHDTSQLTNKISDSVQIKHEMLRTLCSCVVRPHGLLLPVVDHIGPQGPHRTGIVTSKMNRCSRSVTLLHFFLIDDSAPVCGVQALCGVFVQSLIIVRWNLLYCNYLRHLLKSPARRRKMQRAVARECHRATIPHTWDPCVWTHTQAGMCL